MTVNKVMTTVQYPLPSIDDVLGRIGETMVFSKIDCQQAYLQLPLHDDSKKFTTINTCEGLFQYNYLPFGIASSPAIFQSFMSRIFSDVTNVIVYQDDILVMTSTLSDHCRVLDDVLSRLCNAGVKLNAKKCQFFTDSVTYLGHVFSKDGVRPTNKVDAIMNAPTPTNVTQVQSFIGLCNYYRRFVKNFSDVLAPLYLLLRKNTKFVWGTTQVEAFHKIKSIFKSPKILRLFNPKLETAIETDASSYGIGAALLQKHPEGWFPVQFASRTLNSAERNYSQIEREALSVVYGCQYFRQYILGSQFILKNDHKPLARIFSNNSGIPLHCSARLQRWALRLSQFNFNFEYIKGVDNVHGDYLSRSPLRESEPVQEPNELIFVVNSLDDTPVTFVDIKNHTDADPNLCTLKEYIKHGFPNHVHPSVSEFKSNSQDLTIVKGCIMYRNRVFVPKPLRSKILSQFHEGHPGICHMKSIVRALIWYPGIDKDVATLVKQCTLCRNVLPKPSQNCFLEWPTPRNNWSRIHIDHFFFSDKTFLLVIDARSKYIECELVKDTSTTETIETLRQIFSRHGLCETIVSDNATCFSSHEFKTFVDQNCIVHITPPPYSPSSNGQAERAVRVIKELLKKNVRGSLRTRLSNVLLYYRNTPHSTTNVSPSVALNSRTYVTIKEKVNPCFVSDVTNPCNKEIRVFAPGNSVLALNVRPGPKWYKSTVVNKLGNNTYNVLVHDLDVTWKRHLSQLLPLSDSGHELPTDRIPAFSDDNQSNDASVSVTCSNDESVPNENADLRRSTRLRNPVERYVT